MSLNEIWPSVGSFVVGPIEPATQRGFSFVEKSEATRFASSAALKLSSYAISAI